MRILTRLLILLFLSISSLSVYCQVIDAAICDSTVRFPITEYTSFLRTTTPVTIDSVIKFPSSFTKASNEPVLVFNYDPYYYWFRIIIKNTQSNSRNLMLLMAPDGIYEGLLFQKNNGVFKQIAHTGLKYRFKDRSYQFTHHVFPFVIAQNSFDTLYLNIDASNAYKSFGFALIKPNDLKVFENNIYFVFGIIVGLLILFFVLNISLFFALKEKLHLWYALYIVLLFLVVMKNDLLDQEFLGLDSEKAFRLTPYMTIGALAIAILMHVVQNFLKKELKDYKPLSRLSNILKINVLCSAAVHAYVFSSSSNYHIENIVFSWAKISTLLGICIIIANCVYCVNKGFKGALFILFGSSVFLIGSLQRLFIPSTLSFLFPPTTFHIGIILEVFIISMALIYRQRQKEEEAKIEIMNDISRELHDNEGQDLLVAKLNLQYILSIDWSNKTKEKITDVHEQISKTIEDLRDISQILKKKPIDIIEQIKTKCDKINKIGHFYVAFESKIESDVEIVPLDAAQQINTLRMVQEILQNAIKHSGGSKIDILFTYSSNLLSIKVHDNGKGFDLIEQLKSGGSGLKNIEQRCLKLNASYHYETKQDGSGTNVYINIPLKKQATLFKKH